MKAMKMSVFIMFITALSVMAGCEGTKNDETSNLENVWQNTDYYEYNTTTKQLDHTSTNADSTPASGTYTFTMYKIFSNGTLKEYRKVLTCSDSSLAVGSIVHYAFDDETYTVSGSTLIMNGSDSSGPYTDITTYSISENTLIVTYPDTSYGVYTLASKSDITGTIVEL